ncbi:MAG TPA: glycosyltransferase family 2 protein [Candidatus Polarisedimenticolaceae bacterium]|nr:glycosyltransferase family 2 protein [Candidatus Polarisedimenticolaceae bacterium]
MDPVNWAGWLVGLLLFALGLQRLRDLAAVPPLPDRTDPRSPRVSMIVTARDELARIETSVRRAIAQREVELELIVVDDRSADGTREVLERLAREYARLRVLRVDELPDGWLGKPHACHVGAEQARGEWLLFSDADAWMTDRVVARAVDVARREGADHLCLFPGESHASIAARATLLNFSAVLLHYAARANRDERRSMIGVGAFNLVRAEAYREIGGHRRLRFEVVDDLKLGLLLRRAGFRSRAFGAADDVEVHWAPTVPRVVHALEKNMFAMLEFSTPRGLLAIAGLATLVAAALVTPFLGGSGALVASLGWAVSLVPALVMARHTRWGVLPVLLTPFVSPVMVWVVANSVYRTLRRGGICWRGTFYAIDALRDGQVRP